LDQASIAGRVNQKARTRQALLDSAAGLLREGKRPTIEEAALAAGISKRTAYRYFTAQEHLLADAALESLRPHIAEMLSATTASADVRERLTMLARAMTQLAETHEAELRVMVRVADGQAQSATQVPARGRRRLDWIETALRPVKDRLDPDAYQRLLQGLAVCLGFDALIVLRDICGVDGAAAADVISWTAIAVLDRALAEAGLARGLSGADDFA
jgi:AcrR family transcriptional regulator